MEVGQLREFECTWAHLPAKAMKLETTHPPFDKMKEALREAKLPDTVILPLSVSSRAVRDWVHETFDYLPALTCINMRYGVHRLGQAIGTGEASIAFRLAFSDFGDSLLCRLRWT